MAAHKITTHPSERHVRVEHEGAVLAESSRAVELDEARLPTRYYLPREDVRTDLLEASDTTTHCPFKGDATYFSAPGAPDAFWVYESPEQGRRQAGHRDARALPRARHDPGRRRASVSRTSALTVM